jgi:hypothetical protein
MLSAGCGRPDTRNDAVIIARLGRAGVADEQGRVGGAADLPTVLSRPSANDG